jgi:hypothetical protein
MSLSATPLQVHIFVHPALRLRVVKAHDTADTPSALLPPSCVTLMRWTAVFAHSKHALQKAARSSRITCKEAAGWLRPNWEHEAL